MRWTGVRSVVAAAAVLLLAGLGRAACPPSCTIPGGGPPGLDCHAEFTSEGIRLNYPPFDPAKPKAGKEVRCLDGDAACDRDGVANNACVFDVDVCLRNADPALPGSAPADVSAVTVSGTKDADLAALQSAPHGARSRHHQRVHRGPDPDRAAQGARCEGSLQAREEEGGAQGRHRRGHGCGHAQAHLPAARLAVARLRPPQHPRHAARDHPVARDRSPAGAEVGAGPPERGDLDARGGRGAGVRRVCRRR